MTEQEALSKMIAPGTHRPGKYGSDRGFGGVIQIHITRSCDKSCFNCTQGSNLGGKTTFITLGQFEAAVESLRGYRGIVGVFGGNPALHPDFVGICRILRESWVPRNQRGLWCNNPITTEKAKEMQQTFNPSVSNLNVHLDRKAYDLFKAGWPECRPVGLTEDSRHSPCYVAMKDVLRKPCPACGGDGLCESSRKLGMTAAVYGHECYTCHGTGKVYDESRAWELISDCDINKHWSAMIGVFRGQLRAWFCEIAGAQAMLHQDEPDYPDTGLDPTGDWQEMRELGDRDCLGDLIITPVQPLKWWELRMPSFAHQVRKHCHECSVPLRGHGALAQGSEEKEVEQVSRTHADVYKPKRKGRRVELVTVEDQLGSRLGMMTKYLQNSHR